MKIDRKITLRGMVVDVISSNGWELSDIFNFKRLCVKDIKGMALVWLGGKRQPYHKNYIQHMNKVRRKLNSI